MASRSSFWSVNNIGNVSAVGALALCPCLCLCAAGLETPAGTEMQIRLKTKVSTQTSKPKDPVEAVVIAPVMVGDRFAIPAGAVVRGAVEKAAQSSKGDERSVLVLNFTEIEIGGARLKLAAQLTAVENARESLDEQGRINGILASETVSGRLDAGLNKLAEKSAGFADILNTVKNTVLKAPESDIAYDAGVEMDLKLTAPLALKGPSGPGPAAKLKPIANEKALLDLLTAEPFQTMAQKPAKASDITNVMLV